MSPPNSPALKQLHRLDKSSADFGSRLYDMISGEEYVQCEKGLERGDLVWLIDYLDEVWCRHVPLFHSQLKQA